MNSFSLLSKLQISANLGLQGTETSYLENILLDSFMNSAATNGTLVQPMNSVTLSNLAPLNKLAGSLAEFDLISRLNQQSELTKMLEMYCIDSHLGLNNFNDCCSDNNDRCELSQFKSD